MPETALTYTDIDFVADYNAANSTDWLSKGDVVWIAAESRYWLSLQYRNAANTTDCPYTFAIIDPATRAIVGFTDGGTGDYGVYRYWYGAGSSAVFSREIGGSSDYYYRKYATDGTLAVDPSPISTITDGDHTLFPSPSADVLFSSAYHGSESFTRQKIWRWDVETMTPDVVVLENYYDPPTPSLFNAYRPVSDPVYGNNGKLYVMAANLNGEPVNSQLWEIDPADNSATHVATYSSQSLEIVLHRAANDSILVYRAPTSPSSDNYLWIDLSDFSIGTAFSPGAWYTDLRIVRCDDDHDLIEIVVWDGDGVGHFAAVDPDDNFATEPTYYSINDDPYGDGFDFFTQATANGYPNQVWANHYHYDYDTDIEYFYTRIWPGSIASRRWVNVNINMRRR